MQRTNLERRWTEELSRALGGAGLPWRVSSAWCTGDAYAAELTNIKSGASRDIQLSTLSFPSPTERRHEILRQLQDEQTR